MVNKYLVAFLCFFFVQVSWRFYISVGPRTQFVKNITLFYFKFGAVIDLIKVLTYGGIFSLIIDIPDQSIKK